jgi:predicted DNA-binding protein
MIRTMIQLTEEQMQALKALAKQRKTSVAKLVRESVAAYVMSPSAELTLEEKRQRALAAFGQYRSGDKSANVSEEHDQYLEEAYGTWKSS